MLSGEIREEAPLTVVSTAKGNLRSLTYEKMMEKVSRQCELIA